MKIKAYLVKEVENKEFGIILKLNSYFIAKFEISPECFWESLKKNEFEITNKLCYEELHTFILYDVLDEIEIEVKNIDIKIQLEGE